MLCRFGCPEAIWLRLTNKKACHTWLARARLTLSLHIGSHSGPLGTLFCQRDCLSKLHPGTTSQLPLTLGHANLWCPNGKIIIWLSPEFTVCSDRDEFSHQVSKSLSSLGSVSANDQIFLEIIAIKQSTGSWWLISDESRPLVHTKQISYQQQPKQRSSIKRVCISKAYRRHRLRPIHSVRSIITQRTSW